MMDVYIIHPMYNLKFLDIIISRPNLHLAMFACGMFVFISGATLKLNERDESVISFYKRRLTKILIPFYISYILYFCIKAITLHNVHLFGGISKWRFIYTIFGIDEYLNAAGIKTFTLGVGEWFLGCIILCYMFYPLLSYIDSKNRKVFFIVFSIYYIFISTYYDKLNIVMPRHFNFICQIYNFYLGIVFIDTKIFRSILSKSIFEEKNNKIKNALGLLFLLSIVSIIYISDFKIRIPDNILTTIAVIIVFIVCANFESILNSCKNTIYIINKFNKISIEIFLVHHFVIYQIDYMISYRRLRGYEMLCIFIIDFVLVILIAFIVHLINNFIYNFMYKASNQR